MKKLLVLALLVASAASAHEIGTTRVDATFRRDHTYAIEITTGADTLARRLRGGAIDPFVYVELNGKRVAPRVQMLKGPTATTVRLTGDIPRDARQFTWRYDLTFSAYALTIRNEGNAPVQQWLEGDQQSAPFALAAHVIPPTRMEVVRQYLKLGFTHIVPLGLDHILFVLGLFLLTTRAKPLLTQITAFTIAHSITLGLTLYGYVSLPSSIVESAIALSIVFVAVENLTTTELRPWRVVLVFLFGLLHGMGFAGVLRELGLPRSELLTALVSFNVGVELGQLAVVSAAFLLIAQWHRAKPWYRQRVVVPASVIIALVGAFWTVQRIVA